MADIHVFGKHGEFREDLDCRGLCEALHRRDVEEGAFEIRVLCDQLARLLAQSFDAPFEVTDVDFDIVAYDFAHLVEAVGRVEAVLLLRGHLDDA